MTAKTRKRGFFFWFGRIVMWSVMAFVLLQLWYFAHIVIWARVNPSMTSFMETRLAQLRQKDPKAQLTQQWVPYEQISLNLKRAVVASEDSNFVNHNGVEVDAIEEAMKRNARGGRVIHGGSTITQQLAKNLFLTSRRSYIRKGQELLIAFMLEAVWSKHRILEVYLNTAEWGNGIYGAQAAAQHYFRVNASQLSSFQAAKMASMLPAPRYFDRHPGSNFLARKTATVQMRMYQVYVPR